MHQTVVFIGKSPNRDTLNGPTIGHRKTCDILLLLHSRLQNEKNGGGGGGGGGEVGLSVGDITHNYFLSFLLCN